MIRGRGIVGVSCCFPFVSRCASASREELRELRLTMRRMERNDVPGVGKSMADRSDAL